MSHFLDWRYQLLIPDEICFYFPGETSERAIVVHEELEARYPQMIFWLLVQRYWFYVLRTPKAPDMMYDKMKAWVMELEDEGLTSPCFITQAEPRGCSPRFRSGWYLPSRYPQSVQDLFPEESYPPVGHLDKDSPERRGLYQKEKAPLAPVVKKPVRYK